MQLENIIIVTLFLIYGIILGSFLNVCIYRIPKDISVAKGRSFCPSCNHALGAADLIPVFSYLFLGGKCRYCKNKISPRYALIELLTGLLFSVIGYHYLFSLEAVIDCLLCCFLIVLSFIDLDTQEIPDRFHLFILFLGLISILFENNSPWYLSVLGFFIISVPMLLIAYFTDGFGGGDIKLMAASGLLLGAYNIVLAFFIGAFFGAVYGTYLILFKKANRKSAFAFGPFLAIGIFIAELYGDKLIAFYLRLYI